MLSQEPNPLAFGGGGQPPAAPQSVVYRPPEATEPAGPTGATGAAAHGLPAAVRLYLRGLSSVHIAKT